MRRARDDKRAGAASQLTVDERAWTLMSEGRGGAMVALGSVLPIFLPVFGALAGGWLADGTGALWGGIGGFVVGFAAAAATAWLFLQAKG